MGANRLTLIRELEATPQLDGKFSNIRVVNCDRTTGDPLPHAGVLSVVFKADDSISGGPVAIKFFDPDLAGPQATYRAELFMRESELLEKTQGVERCLQLLQPMSQLDLVITDPATGNSLTKDTYYLVTEWLEGDLNQYFLRQQNYGAEEKLELFRNVALAVFGLHQRGIHHRDLKADNLRYANRRNAHVVVAIDLGTAARYDSLSLGNSNAYANPVGAPAFAPIEAHCGLAGVRKLGVYGDIYALGCLLHDLFNVDYFPVRLNNDPGFHTCFGACHSHIVNASRGGIDRNTLIKEWDSIISLTKAQVTIPSIDAPGTTVPPSVRDILNKLLRQLTAIDYRDRLNDPNKILHYVDAALRILRNHVAQKKRLALRRKIKERRRKNIARLEQRIAQYLSKSR